MMVLMHIAEKIGHCRSRVLDEFVGYSPHLLEGAVDDPAAQVGAHEQHRVIDRLQNCVELIKQRAALDKGCFGKLRCLLRRLLAALQLRNIEVGEQAAAVGKGLNLEMDDAAVAEP